MKERLLSAKCSLHGSRRCEVFLSNLAAHKDRRRWKKASRAAGKKQEREWER